MAQTLATREILVGLIVSLCISGCQRWGQVYGLRPEYPEALFDTWSADMAFSEVDSVQPTFRWEAFPRPQDRKADKDGIQNRIRDVTYDLQIWRAEDAYPTEVIYRRRGLPEALHQLETPLELCRPYFWTVRARFKLNGETRVTEWGATPPYEKTRQRAGLSEQWAASLRSVEPAEFAGRLPRVPNPFSYRFKTPCQKPGSSE